MKHIIIPFLSVFSLVILTILFRALFNIRYSVMLSRLGFIFLFGGVFISFSNTHSITIYQYLQEGRWQFITGYLLYLLAFFLFFFKSYQLNIVSLLCHIFGWFFSFWGFSKIISLHISGPATLWEILFSMLIPAIIMGGYTASLLSGVRTVDKSKGVMKYLSKDIF